MRYLVCFIKPTIKTVNKISRSLLAFFVLFGTLLTPIQAKAGVFSSFLGSDVLAQTNEVNGGVTNPFQFENNSQSIELLQANISLATILKDKNNTEIDTTKNINIVSDNALLPTVGSTAATGGSIGGDTDASFDEISVYVVRKGDAISQIAEMYDVSVNTILWANDMKKGDTLKEGDTLFILPISGVKHVVTKGQTLKSIAQKYSADIVDIVSFNGISEDTKLAVGDELIIPDGEIFIDGPVKSTNTNKNSTSPKTSLKSVAGYFINPVVGYIKTQGLHGKNAVDLAAPIGTPIKAAASGKVLLARMGWNGAYGNMVIIQHPNGTKTLYSHLSKLASTTGQTVNQGEVIGYVGNSGRVRAAKGGNGAHLHFEVYNAKNPGADGSWAR